MKFNYLFLTLALIGASVLPIKALAEEVETPKEDTPTKPNTPTTPDTPSEPDTPSKPEPVLWYKEIKEEGSAARQIRIYLTKDGEIASGSADIV